METKTINQSHLTSECWTVQFWGLNQCETCEARDTSDCGGQKIRQTGKNENGYSVPVN